MTRVVVQFRSEPAAQPYSHALMPCGTRQKEHGQHFQSIRYDVKTIPSPIRKILSPRNRWSMCTCTCRMERCAQLSVRQIGQGSLLVMTPRLSVRSATETAQTSVWLVASARAKFCAASTGMSLRSLPLLLMSVYFSVAGLRRPAPAMSSTRSGRRSEGAYGKEVVSSSHRDIGVTVISFKIDGELSPTCIHQRIKRQTSAPWAGCVNLCADLPGMPSEASAAPARAIVYMASGLLH